MTETVALPSFDELCTYVRRTLCERDALDVASTAFVRTPLLRGDDLWGYVFHVEGPRMLRTSAVWAGFDGKIIFYNSTGERVQDVALAESPAIEYKKAA